MSSNVLKVGHHGSKTSSAQDFIEVVSPDFAVISAGKNNRYGHPHIEVLNTLEKNSAEILRTTEGSVEFKSNGRTLIKK